MTTARTSWGWVHVHTAKILRVHYASVLLGACKCQHGALWWYCPQIDNLEWVLSNHQAPADGYVINREFAGHLFDVCYSLFNAVSCMEPHLTLSVSINLLAAAQMPVPPPRTATSSAGSPELTSGWWVAHASHVRIVACTQHHDSCLQVCMGQACGNAMHALRLRLHSSQLHLHSPCMCWACALHMSATHVSDTCSFGFGHWLAPPCQAFHRTCQVRALHQRRPHEQQHN